jgi:hypothetical protein
VLLAAPFASAFRPAAARHADIVFVGAAVAFDAFFVLAETFLDVLATDVGMLAGVCSWQP